MKTRLAFPVLATLFFASSLSLAASEAVVLDTDGLRLARVDLTSGKVLASLTLPVGADSVVRSPDGSRLVILFRGEGKETFWTGTFLPTTRSSAMVVDSATLEAEGTVELAWAVGNRGFAADGSLLVLAPGVQTRKPAETKNGELIRFNITDPGKATRLPLGRPASVFGISPDEKVGILFFPAAPKASPARKAEIRFVDLTTMEQVGSVTLDGEPDEPVAFPSGSNLYVLDRGTGRNPGKLHVVSIDKRAVAGTLELGAFPIIGGMDPESGTLFVLNVAPKAKGDRSVTGELHVIRGTDIAATIQLGHSGQAMRLSNDRKRAFISGGVGFSIVDLESARADSLTIGGSAADILVAPDERSAVVYHRGPDWCCNATVLDLENGKAFETFQTGSKGARIVQALEAAAASISSYQSAKSAAARSGANSFSYTVYTPRAGEKARGPLAFAPDGTHAYALDTQTNDATVIDIATGKRSANLGVASGGEELVPLGDGRVIAVVAAGGIDLIDTAEQKLLPRVDLGGNIVDFVMTPDRRHAVAVSRGLLVTLDEKGTVVSRITTFKRPVQLLFP